MFAFSIYKNSFYPMKASSGHCAGVKSTTISHTLLLPGGDRCRCKLNSCKKKFTTLALNTELLQLSGHAEISDSEHASVLNHYTVEFRDFSKRAPGS